MMGEVERYTGEGGERNSQVLDLTAVNACCGSVAFRHNPCRYLR